jgi:hypothetical protein
LNIISFSIHCRNTDFLSSFSLSIG